MKSKLFMSVLSLLFVICICLITSSDSIAGKFKVGDNVITNKYYHHLYGETKKGTVIAIFDLKDINHSVIGLSTGEDISEYWLEKDVYGEIGYPPIPLCYGSGDVLQSQSKKSGWYVGQKVWDIFNGRGIVSEISDPKIYLFPVVVTFDSGLVYWYDNDDLFPKNGKPRLSTIEVKTITYSLDELYPESKYKYKKCKCKCECIGCE